MTDIRFINRIEITRVRNLRKKNIDFNTESCKHLIITGSNGSGKTTLLNKIHESLRPIIRNNYLFEQYIEQTNSKTGIRLGFTGSKKGETLFTLKFSAHRQLKMNIPNGVVKLNLNPDQQNLSLYFLQYMVHLKTQAAYANLEKNSKYLDDINNWFKIFEKSLKYLYDEPDLKIKYDPKIYNFEILIKDKEPFSLLELSDGYSSIINIISEIIIKMKYLDDDFNFNLGGIVFIDEIETHLHIELQQKILPFLCKFFPNIQFIITTHSPFVLTSIKNALIYDLEDNILTEDLSKFTYTAIIEKYFKTSEYSALLMEKLKRYEELSISRTEESYQEFLSLKNELSSIPTHLSKELHIKLKYIKSLQLNQEEN